MTNATLYDDVASAYDARAESAPLSVLYDMITQAELGRLLPPPPARILDAGAGTGRVSLGLVALGYSVTLLDPSRSMLEEARRKATALPRVDLVQGDIADISAADGVFDFVICEGDPLGYCRDAADAAKELLRVLRPGGAFYAVVDNRWFAAERFLAAGMAEQAVAALRDGASQDPYKNPIHAFDPGELYDVFDSAGALNVAVRGKVGIAHRLPFQYVASMMQDDRGRMLLAQIELATTRNPQLAGLGSHLQVTGQKRGAV